MRRLFASFALVSLVAIACGTASDSNVSIKDAPSLAQSEGSFRMAITGTSELPEEAGGGRLNFSATGAIDATSKLGEATFTFSGEGGQAEAISGSMGEMDVVYDFTEGFVMYMNWPFFREQIPNAKKWLRMDLQKIGEEMGFDLAGLMQAGQGNPLQGLDYLKGASDIQEVGEETIRGIDTTHYEAVVEFDSLAETSPDVADSLENLKELTGIEEIPMEVWLDADGLPRRVEYVFDYNPSDDAPVGTPSGQMEIANEFFDYGVDLDIEVPPSSEVTDLYELIRRGG
jgi:hypothetical protein